MEPKTDTLPDDIMDLSWHEIVKLLMNIICNNNFAKYGSVDTGVYEAAKKQEEIQIIKSSLIKQVIDLLWRGLSDMRRLPE